MLTMQEDGAIAHTVASDAYRLAADGEAVQRAQREGTGEITAYLLALKHMPIRFDYT
jgi:hypothetical protein